MICLFLHCVTLLSCRCRCGQVLSSSTPWRFLFARRVTGRLALARPRSRRAEKADCHDPGGDQQVVVNLLGHLSPPPPGKGTQRDERERPQQRPRVSKERKVRVPEPGRSGQQRGDVPDPREEVAPQQPPVPHPLEPDVHLLDLLRGHVQDPAELPGEHDAEDAPQSIAHRDAAAATQERRQDRGAELQVPA